MYYRICPIVSIFPGSIKIQQLTPSCRFRRYSSVPKPPISSGLKNDDVPHVTVIRPCKGKEPYLYQCLASTFKQAYPHDKLTIYLCVSSREDAAYSTIERVLRDYPEHDATLLVEEEDPALNPVSPHDSKLGPNPKIRNMSRAYREAKGDIVWILDCNVWVGRGACGRMVDRLHGYSHSGQKRPFKFVHHLPLAIDVSSVEAAHNDHSDDNYEDLPALTTVPSKDLLPASASYFGGRLDEAFLSSAHAKMYVAINTVAVAPCICGKSSMFRRSHLNALTNNDKSTDTRFGSGIDYFSENICEDHLIGDLLWKARIPDTMPAAAKSWKNHGLLYGDLAIQPVADMSMSNYIARRVRWLRVRKYTVPAATLVEPGTESFVCSAMGAFGATSSSYTKTYFGDSWLHMVLLWTVSIAIWIVVDWTVYILLQSGKTVEITSSGDQQKTHVPPFAQPLGARGSGSRRPFMTWLKAWLSREALALPVWTWAIWGGATVVWRDKKLWVGFDMKVYELDGDNTSPQRVPLLSGDHNGTSQANGRPASQNGLKARQD